MLRSKFRPIAQVLLCLILLILLMGKPTVLGRQAGVPPPAPPAISRTANVTASEPKGVWIEHPFEYPSIGAVGWGCGDDCLAITQEDAKSMLFFDIHKSAWTELEFNTPQTIHYMEVEGHVVFAHSDELLIGYSALTSSYDVVAYSGSSLHPTKANFGCGKNLAFFFTDERMYVFDAQLGYWQEYDYGLPADHVGNAEYVVKDDYVWVNIYRDEAYEPPKAVVYSLHTHSFNQLEYGCYYSPNAVLDHGFARSHALGSLTEDFQLVGYSAFTNDFSVVQVSDQGRECSSTHAPFAVPVDENTNFAVTFRATLDPYAARGEFYGYDTRRGFWSHTTRDFAVLDERYSGSWRKGGEYSVDNSIYNGSEIYHFIFYSGLTGAFHHAEPGISADSPPDGTLCGGTAFVAFDAEDAWGYDLVTELSSCTVLSPGTHIHAACGDDYCTFSRYDESETMAVYFYNSETGNWTTAYMPKKNSGGGASYNKHVYVFCSYDPTLETIFYSSILDTYVKREFPAGGYVNRKVNGNLVWAGTADRSYLYDGETGEIYQFDFQFDQDGLGNASFTSCDRDNKTLYGYSTLSRQWSSMAMEDTPIDSVNHGLVGLFSNETATQMYTRYYAYNGLKDSWVALEPAGAHKGRAVGDRTALVVRSDRVYAFDPDSGGASYDHQIYLPLITKQP